REFAVTLSTAIVVSLIISLTTTPMMCSRLLRHNKDRRHGRIYHISESAFAWLLEHYRRSLQVVLRHPFVTLIVLLFTIAMNVVLFLTIPGELFPTQDNGTIAGGIQGDMDASYQAMQQVTVRFARIATNDPAVAGVIAFTGGGGPANTGFIYMALKPLQQRKISSLQVVNRLRSKFAVVPGATVYTQPGQDLRIGGRSSNAGYQYTIQSENLDDVNKWGPILLEKMKKLKGFTDVNSDQENNGLQASLVYDRNTAARLGIPVQLIDSTLYDAFGQEDVSTMYSALNQYYVVMEVQPQFWQNPHGLDMIYLHATNSSAMVPLSAITHYKPTVAPIAVNHTGQFPSATLSFNLVPGFALGDAEKEVQQMVESLKMPSTLHGDFAGNAAAYKSSLYTELWLVITALLAVYIVLGILYESYIHPITILSTLPSAGVGAVLALMLFNTPLSLIAVIGIILLIGIVKKNAILMVDFALSAEREHHIPPKEAIYQACLLRFRPILMTTFSAMFGALPLVISNGIGSELRRPLGIAIVGGLMLSQVLTLYTTPVVYLYFDRLSLWWASLRRPAHVPPPIPFGYQEGSVR
ncbi:MAG TPA: efflux RND transporter permease subunit, partial [Candidatus Acidoferrum sp.]|nr:efflux RND transporter permease subunit [Candidatus Acidoferrum sp.]